MTREYPPPRRPAQAVQHWLNVTTMRHALPWRAVEVGPTVHQERHQWSTAF